MHTCRLDVNLVRRGGRGRFRVVAVLDAAHGGVKNGLRVAQVHLQQESMRGTREVNLLSHLGVFKLTPTPFKFK